MIPMPMTATAAATTTVAATAVTKTTKPKIAFKKEHVNKCNTLNKQRQKCKHTDRKYNSVLICGNLRVFLSLFVFFGRAFNTAISTSAAAAVVDFSFDRLVFGSTTCLNYPHVIFALLCLLLGELLFGNKPSPSSQPLFSFMRSHLFHILSYTFHHQSYHTIRTSIEECATNWPQRCTLTHTSTKYDRPKNRFRNDIHQFVPTY